MKKVLTYIVIIGIALVFALNYALFVFPNNFAPSGLNGLCTMIQHVFGISVGYLSLLINVPLALLVFWKVSRPLAIRSMVYVVTFSLALVVLEYVDLSQIAYSTESSIILGPLVGGVISGACSSLLYKTSAYTGGTDFIASLIHKYHPEKSVIYLIMTLNIIVALLSYFVYDYQVEPVILCILYTFASSTVADRLTKNGRSAIRFEIITDYPDQISDEIIHKLHHSATLIPGTGMYLGRKTNILICVVNTPQVAAMMDIVRSYPNTFATVSSVGEVMGNFQRIKNNGEFEKELLDLGDTQAV